MNSFSDNFLADTTQVLQQISITEIESLVEILEKTRSNGGRLFLVGSGGGAGHASHATCDFRKLCGIEAYCVSDNVSELTARINDDGWDTSYSKWLEASRLSALDCLLVFSVGGGRIHPPVSLNLVNAVLFAEEMNANIVGIVGRNGGFLRERATASVLIPTVEKSYVTPQAEGLQAVIWHLIVSHPKLAVSLAKWEGIESEKRN